MSKINNLSEFLRWRGCGDEPYGWARAFYKYTDCGPWAVFLLKDGGEVYYEDLRREGAPPVTDETCSGIKFGSIVEGSDAESGPYYHEFPLDTEAFDRDVVGMEEETTFYWERDNYQWYRLHVLGHTYYLHQTWEGVVWDEAPSRKLRKKVEAFLEGDAEIPQETWRNREEHKPLRIPGTRADIEEYVNDGVF